MTALALLLVMMSACDQAPPPDTLKIGGAFPPLVLSGLDGSRLALDDYRGKLVILNIWATWCAPCRTELPSLDRLAAQLDERRFVVIGLSVDSDRDIAREYLLDQGIHLRSYIDPEQKISRDILGVRVYPDSLLISPGGKLLRRFVGARRWDEPRMIQALRQAATGSMNLLNKF